VAKASKVFVNEAEGEEKVIYVFDTDVLTLASIPNSPEHARLQVHALELGSNDLYMTSIVSYEEQTRGWLAYAAKSRTTKEQIGAYAKLKRHLRFYVDIEVLDFDEAAGAEFDRLRNLKLRVGIADLKIAAIAIS
jgi:tRNA(fMet)-specific endonuclease VapC